MHGWNIKIHNKLAEKYERIHIEIYNHYEQTGLKAELKEAISNIDSGGNTKKVLDFGCGAGNLTEHLSSLGCDVISCPTCTGFFY